MSENVELDVSNPATPAEGADETHQSAVLEEIRTARQRARRSLVELKQRGGARSVDAAGYRQAAAELEGFLLSIEPLLLDPQFEKAEHYREEVNLGVTEIAGERYAFPGLLSMVPVEGVEVEEEVEQPGRMGGTQTETVVKPVPVAILANAFREANHFLQANGLGLRLEASEVDETGGNF
jgi:hypothetical protein